MHCACWQQHVHRTQHATMAMVMRYSATAEPPRMPPTSPPVAAGDSVLP